jgi:C-terminal processing protease CtpA/Prc
MISILFLFIIVSSQTIKLLKDGRDVIDYYPYTATERQTTAYAIKNMFEIYVNTPSKIQHYGFSKDPSPKIKKIYEKAYDMTNRDFHLNLSQLFLSLRDLHTRYKLPGASQCLMAIQGISVVQIESEGKVIFVVESVSTFPLILSLSPNLNSIKIGDEVTSVNGLPISDYIDTLKDISGGANESGSMRTSLRYMASVKGSYNEMPANDSVIYGFISRANGESYIFDLPYLLYQMDYCLAENEKHILKQMKLRNDMEDVSIDKMNPIDLLKPESVNPTTVLKRNPWISPLKISQVCTNENFDDDIYDILYKREDQSKLRLEFLETINPMIQYAIYDPKTKNMGIIKIMSFLQISDATPLKSTLMIRSLLLNELKNTNSILFDVRGNKGGDAILADLIPQLFVQPFESLNMHLKNNKINHDIFNSQHNMYYLTPESVDVVNKASWKSKYTEYEKLTPEKYNNQFGMVYLNPVGVFTDATCYSSCELFAANLQDMDVATIYGQDDTTGGGGANLVSWEGFLIVLAQQYFPLPKSFEDGKSDNGGIGVTIGWREMVRVGKNAGKRIEDFGVESDVVIRPRLEDILPGSIIETQYERISLDLYDKKLSKNLVTFELLPELQGDFIIGKEIKFEFKTKGVNSIIIENDLTKTKILHSITNDDQSNIFTLNSGLFTYGIFQFNIYGYKDDQEIIQTKRYFKSIPKIQSYIKVEKEIELLNSPFYHYDQNKNIENHIVGFTKFKDLLVVGNNTQYENNLNTEVVFYLYTHQKSKISIKVLVDTIPNLDLFFFGYIYQNIEYHLLTTSSYPRPKEGVSGIHTIDQTFDIDDIGAIGVFCRFTSDRYLVKKGVEVSSIKISPQ